jgi:hypothetical protein
MARKGVIIRKGKIGPSVAGKPFKTSALIMNGIAVAGKLTLGQVYQLYRPSDANALGLDEAYDTTNNVVVYHHISEFYAMAGEGVPLYIMVVAQSVLPGTMLDDASSLYCKKLIIEAKGEIFQLGLCFNPQSSYTETAVDGLNSDIRAAIKKAQTLHEWAYDTFRPVQILLEGRNYTGPAASALNLRAVPDGPAGATYEADRVSVVVAQDWDFAETLTGLARKYADVGTALGTIAAGEVNECIGEVETRNLSDADRGRWLTAALSNHTKTSAQEADLDTLHDKGYIFADLYPGVSGYRFNGDPTCTPIIVDADGNMNCHTIGYGRTFDFSARNLRAALLPLVNKVKPVDTATGKLPTGVIKDIEAKGNDVFDDMAAQGWLSGGKMTVDPDSDILVEKLLETSFKVVPYGTIGLIDGTMNLKTKL